MAEKVLQLNTNNDYQEVILSPSSVDLGNVTNDAQIAKSTVTTKGDLLVATSNATLTRKAVGKDSYQLMADSSKTEGIEWKYRPHPFLFVS